MPNWDYSEYFDEDGKPRRGSPKKPNFLGKILAAVRRLVASVRNFIDGVGF